MAWYRAGTASVTNGSTTVTGAATAWVANVQPGHAINLPDGRAYEVQRVVSDTELKLGSSYLGSTAGGQPYSIQPNQGFAQYAAQLVTQLISDYQQVLLGMGAGAVPPGSVEAPGLRGGNDPDTGVNFPGANLLQVITAGVVRLFVNALGMVGIGLTAPRARLHVAEDFGLSSPFQPRGATIVEAAYTRTDNGQYVARCLLTGISDYAAMVQATDPSFNLAQLAINPLGGYVSIGTSLYKDPLTVNGTIAHAQDNVSTFGTAAYRAAGIYLGSSPNVTSDGRQKQVRGDGRLTAAEMRIAAAIGERVTVYQLLDAIEKKGEDQARLHVGLIAQEVVAAFTAEGLDWQRYGLIGLDAWAARAAVPPRPAQPAEYDDDGRVLAPALPAFAGEPARPAGEAYNLRYEEVLTFLFAAERQERLTLANRIAALEAG